MGVYLDVPYANQLRFPGQSHAMNDPTGCWYASACMVGWFFEAGPRQGVPEIHTGTLPPAIRARIGFQGHFATGSADARRIMQNLHNGQSEHDLLARRENLTPVEHCAEAAYQYGHQELELLLRRYGPIFFYWQKTHDGQTYGHASVLVGVHEQSPDLEYHDPENAPNSRMTLADFNAQRQRWQYALMRRAGNGHHVPAQDA